MESITPYTLIVELARLWHSDPPLRHGLGEMRYRSMRPEAAKGIWQEANELVPDYGVDEVAPAS